jgi:hypothetical protein
MLAICGLGWKSVPGTCQDAAEMLAICGRAGTRCGRGRNSVPGTCPGRGGMLAICCRAGTRCQAPVQGAVGC